jgi:hypothetical protein
VRILSGLAPDGGATKSDPVTTERIHELALEAPVAA